MIEQILETEDVILLNLIYNESFFRKVLPFIKKEYFSETSHRLLQEMIEEYAEKYNERPTKESLLIDVDSKSISGDEYDNFVEMLVIYDKNHSEGWELEWLVDTAEDFCKERALFNAMKDAISVVREEDIKGSKSLTKTEIPEKISEALAVTFDSHVGHDYLEDAESRFDKIREKEDRIPFNLEWFNAITRGGVVKKSLNVLMAGPGGFKSGTLCHLAADYMLSGQNVLYISLEMSEERISERVDCNLTNMSIENIEEISKKRFMKKIEDVRQKTVGRLFVKEYPTSSAHVGNFRYLLRELKTKQNFKPDVIIIDYLNICASSRYKGQVGDNYSFVKTVAEEVRGLGVEFDVPVWSATQLNRTGFKSENPDMDDTAESFGLPATTDLFIVIISDEELENLGQMKYKQLKNRYNDKLFRQYGILGCDKAKFKLFDVDQASKENITPMNSPLSKNSIEEEKKKKFQSFNF